MSNSGADRERGRVRWHGLAAVLVPSLGAVSTVPVSATDRRHWASVGAGLITRIDLLEQKRRRGHRRARHSRSERPSLSDIR
jgi:hypothetical protein